MRDDPSSAVDVLLCVLYDGSGYIDAADSLAPEG